MMKERIIIICAFLWGFLIAVGENVDMPDLSVKPVCVQTMNPEKEVYADSGHVSVFDRESVVYRHYQRYKMRPYNAPFMMDLLIGPAISLGSHGGRYDWAGPRPNAINWFTWRFAYYPFHHWGAYVSLAFSSYKPRQYWSEMLGVPLIKQGAMSCMLDPGNAAIINGASEIGLTYQVTYLKWVFQARAGYGTYKIGRGDEVLGEYNKEDEYGAGYDPVFEVCRHIYSTHVTFGITFGYRMSRWANLVMSVDYRHPFHHPEMWISRYDGVRNPNVDYSKMHMERGTSEKKIVSQTPWGRDLSISIGLQFVTECSKSKRK